jgi:hypothetical protein
VEELSVDALLVGRALLEQKWEQERLRGGPESVRELMARGRALEGVRALRGPSRTYGAGGEQPARRMEPAPSGEGRALAPCGAMGKCPNHETFV